MAEWDRQDSETDKSYHAFGLYRGMPPSIRSLERVRIELDRGSGYLRMLMRWSSKHRWVVRVRQYDAAEDVEVRERRRKMLADMQDTQAREGVVLQRAGIRTFVDKETGQLREDLTLTPKIAIQAIEVGSKLERVARDMPSEVIKIIAKPLDEYTDEELEIIMAGGAGE